MSPWRNRLARSAVNRKVGGSSPPGDDTFGLARRKLFHYLNFIISVILLVLHCNKEIWKITFLVTIVFFWFYLGASQNISFSGERVPSKTQILPKCISFSSLLACIVMFSDWVIQPLYKPLLVNITPLDAGQFTRGYFSSVIC